MNELSKYIVMKLPPYKRHDSIESAKADAEREFNNTPLGVEYAIVQVVAKISPKVVPKWEEFK